MKMGIQNRPCAYSFVWIPSFEGMTEEKQVVGLYNTKRPKVL